MAMGYRISQFNKVKDMLAKDKIHPSDPEADIVITTDACQDGVGAVLCNKVNGTLKTVSCALATLT